MQGTPGLSFGKLEDKLGWNAQPTTAVMLDGVRVPASARLGEEGQGFAIAMTALDGGRVNIASCSLGGAAFCLDTAAAHVRDRTQFGRPIADFQATQFKLADMATGLHTSRLAVRHAARALDARSPAATLAAAMAKRYATDTCYGITNDALQLLGGYGCVVLGLAGGGLGFFWYCSRGLRDPLWQAVDAAGRTAAAGSMHSRPHASPCRDPRRRSFLKEYPVERYMRDLRVHSILEGTNEVMRVIINREMNKMAGF